LLLLLAAAPWRQNYLPDRTTTYQTGLVQYSSSSSLLTRSVLPRTVQGANHQSRVSPSWITAPPDRPGSSKFSRITEFDHPTLIDQCSPGPYRGRQFLAQFYYPALQPTSLIIIVPPDRPGGQNSYNYSPRVSPSSIRLSSQLPCTLQGPISPVSSRYSPTDPPDRPGTNSKHNSINDQAAFTIFSLFSPGPEKKKKKKKINQITFSPTHQTWTW